MRFPDTSYPHTRTRCAIDILFSATWVCSVCVRDRNRICLCFFYSCTHTEWSAVTDQIFVRCSFCLLEEIPPNSIHFLFYQMFTSHSFTSCEDLIEDSLEIHWTLSPNKTDCCTSRTLFVWQRLRSPRFHHMVPSSCVARLSSLPPSPNARSGRHRTSKPSGVRSTDYY